MENLGVNSTVVSCMRYLNVLLLGLILGWITAPAAAELHPLAVKALDDFEALEIDGWSYTVTTTSKNGKKVERHDATRSEGQRWTLVLLDGRNPSAPEQDEYRLEKAEQRKRREKGKNTRRTDVDRSTLRLVSETDHSVTFSFRPKTDGEADAMFMKEVWGTLVVNKDGGWVENFELASASEIRPMAGVKVTEFRLVMSFRRDPTSGSILPESIRSRVRGRAFVVKSLDDDTEVRFTGYVHASSPSPSTPL